MPATRIVLLTRLPAAGAVKSRLTSALGAGGAAALQRELTAHALAWARAAAAGTAELEVRFCGGTVDDMRRVFGPGFDYVAQDAGDLGARMLAAFRCAADAGMARTLVIGSDCPGLDADRLREAIRRLVAHDAVLGPARDGGYYLIGLRAPEPALFEGIAWGGSTVCRDTVERARGLGLDVALLDTLDDIDRPADLHVWRRERRRRPVLRAGACVSVIVPALDEASQIGPLLERLKASSEAELIVADGGSRDATPRLAQAHGARVVAAPAGRARQMNAGAASAAGDVLLFLHADTELPDRFENDVREALADPRAAGGAFRFALDAPGRHYRVLERLVGWRVRVLGLPYGDQALFVRADVFRGIGGFSDVELLEDVALVRALRPRGRLVITRSAARTSARLWRDAGFARVTIANLFTVLAHFAGVPAARIARVRRRLLRTTAVRSGTAAGGHGRCRP